MEILDICDENGFPTGETISREAAHRDGILHRTAHVWIVRKTVSGYDILLQKRSMEKESFPGLYDTSSAGHIPAGEEPVPSALRELKEELGIAAQARDLAFAGTFRIQYEKEFHGNLFRDNEVTSVYVYRKPVDIGSLRLQAGEVDEVQWFDLNEVCTEIQTCRERFCVPSAGLQVLKKYLFDRADFAVLSFGDENADTLLLQMVDEYDLKVIEQEVSYIRELSGRQDFCLKAVQVHSWNLDLGPWPAPAVFGKEDFGDGAAQTLEYLLNKVIKEDPDTASRSAGRKVYLGGYSLAGLFALWAGYQTDRFDGIAAASPSIWYPGFIDFMKERKIRTDLVYLSLGDREEKTRNPVMSTVGGRIRDAYEILNSTGVKCILEWNKGNHFREPDLRTARAFAWLLAENLQDDFAFINKHPEGP